MRFRGFPRPGAPRPALRPVAGILFAAVAAAAGPAGAAPVDAGAGFTPALEVADSPTASTLFARMFHLNARFFRGGGIVTRASAAFNNSLQLGVAFKANNVVGGGRVVFDSQPEQVVAAIVKLKIVSLPASRLQLAAGYDGMAYDLTRKRGIYGVLSKEMTPGDFVFRAHAGAGAVRFRSDPSASTPGPLANAFAGVTGSLSEEIHLGIEYDDVLWQNGSFNAMVAYTWDVGLRLEVDFKSLFRGWPGHHRVMKIQYTF